MALGVNIDHVATLRQQRLDDYPDPLQAALRAEDAGADLITLHLREDRRHIQDADVRAIRPVLRTRMNLECAITPDMLAIACGVRPQDVCLVPENRRELTTEGGLDVLGRYDSSCRRRGATARRRHPRVPVHRPRRGPDRRRRTQVGARVIELHTGAYADAADAGARAAQLERVRATVAVGMGEGLRVNAGHGLHYGNVEPVAALAGIAELNIGHAIVARAVFDGWEPAIRRMKALMIRASCS